MPVLSGGISRSTRVPRYPSDMSDAEWAVIEPTLPAPGLEGRARAAGRRSTAAATSSTRSATWSRRASSGGRCRATSRTGGPSTTCWTGWQDSGATEAMHDELRRQCRIAAGRKPEPTAAVIDSQSVKAAETVARASRGYDAGKKVNGRKRHIAVDTIGLLLTVLITAAGVQDRDGARPLLWNLRKAFPHGQARLGRRRLRRQAGHLGEDQAQAQAHTADRQAHRAAHVQGAAAPLGGGADLGLDHQVTPHGPRLRAAARAPRDHRLLGDDHHHEPAPRTT